MIQEKRKKRLLIWILCTMLSMAVSAGAAGCNGSTDAKNSVESGTPSESESQTPSESESQTASADTDSTERRVLGEGRTSFDFDVIDQDGGGTKFEIHTDKETVGEALMELGLIEGDESEYGLYVKTVTGITADYDKDGKYWAFYINEEYAQTGVDATAIAEGDSYSFKIE